MLIKRLFVIFALFIGYTNLAISSDIEENYGGIQYSRITYTQDTYGEYNPSMVIGRVGYFYDGKNPVIEGRFGFGVSDDSKSVLSNTDTTLEVSNLLGIYLTGYIPSTDSMDFYGFAGMSQVTVSTSVTTGGSGYRYTTKNRDTDTSLSYGAGMNIELGESIALNLEYANYYRKDDITIDALALGLSFSL